MPDFAIPHDARSPRRSKSPKANVHRPLHYFNPQNHPLDFQKTQNYEGWHPQVATILTAVDETFKWALFDRSPLPEWTQGRVALLGDACHPMLPFMAQGAAQAIEDGATLVACLKQTVFNVPTALQAYVSSRKPRTTALQERSQAFSGSFHLHDGPEQQARDHTYATVGLRGNREAMNELYGHDAEAAFSRFR